MGIAEMHRVDSAYILAGGRSSRFGKNKAVVSVLGEPQIVRLAKQLASDGLEVCLVAQNSSDYLPFGIPTIEDSEPNSGPFAGVLAALQHSLLKANVWCVICSCDMFEWQLGWRSILDETMDSEPHWDIAVLAGNQEGEDCFRPFPGLYRADLFREGSEMWDRGVRSLRGFHQALAPRIRSCPIAENLLPKYFNTPAELAELLSGKD
jgi:molybdenum cofactor guanylyltransferase